MGTEGILNYSWDKLPKKQGERKLFFTKDMYLVQLDEKEYAVNCKGWFIEVIKN